MIGGGVSAWDALAPRMFAELRERSLVYVASAPDDPLNPYREPPEVAYRARRIPG